MPTALAISPHLDDAVFSAGGTLARRAREGWRVVVATVFTASVPDPRGFALACQLDKGLPAETDYMALRRDEDAAACRTIGAEPVWLPFAEAPHRGYGSAKELFAGLRGDDAIVAEISLVLADLIRGYMPDEVFAPQAIGAHVDHVALYLALRSCIQPLRLWADFPYAVRPRLQPSPFADEINRFAADDITLNSVEARTKAEAVSSYTSQLDFQFGGTEAAFATIVGLGSIETFAHRLMQAC